MVAKVVKKMERPYCFQKKAHKEQTIFNEALGDRLSEAELQLSQATRLLEYGLAKLALKKLGEASRVVRMLLHRGRN